MPIRVACPECSARLSVSDDDAGTVVECPKCGTPMEVPVAPTRRPARDEPADEDEDRPRPRGKPRRKKPAAGFPAWATVALVGLAAVAVGIGVYLATRGKPGEAAAGGGGGLFGGGATGGVKYVPRESEKKFMALSKQKGDAPITEAEVLATMGEPTHRGPVIKGQKNGVSFTLQEWEWKVPGSGIESSMGIVNGHANGQVIGLEVTPLGSKPARPGDDD